ncbi:methyltransferase domain-containing protein [Streptomyces sp. SDr-06]|uniref:class I SAM-dependent methyltransferase n=1 Tax=Streptomyces sp. SDr-06 TaxID=2267702 RepID=UPI000DEAFB0D|nr:methyltransferase domain-containing protein [Streptomyces sp. SDr-06]RCH67442.1 methyltransferase domain-containing protein [Streptomyces sp. SDr-06]
MSESSGVAQPPVPPEVQKAYGPADLGSQPLFGGGFINFGYWQDIDLDRPLTESDRIRSQQAMYRHVLTSLAPTEGARALEVGCGLGAGAAVAVEECGFAHVTGMDIHPEQLGRAEARNAELLGSRPARLCFTRGAAESMPFADAEFDCVYSIEAAQHFRDLGAFARETARVLRPGGRAVVASFFVPGDGGGREAQLAELLDTFARGLDVAHTVPRLVSRLREAGLTRVRATSIGASVWPGWDRWLATMWKPGTWPRNFLRAFHEGLLDYYAVTAERPEG